MNVKFLIKEALIELGYIDKKSLNETSFYDVAEYVSDEFVKKVMSDGYMDETIETFLSIYMLDNDLEEEDENLIKKSEGFIEYFKENEIEPNYREVKENIWNEINDDNDTIRIYRAMTVDDNWLNHLKTQGKRIGEYWTWDKDSADTHWGNFNQKNVALITSVVLEKYVDWDETIYLNIIQEEEREIRLFKNTPIKIESIEINDKPINISVIKNKIFKA